MVAGGSLVAWWDGDAVAFGVAAGEEKGRLRLVGPGGREERVAPGRVACVVEQPGRAPGPGLEERRAAGERAAAAAERTRAAAAGIDVALLWEVALDAPEPLDLEALAALALGEPTGPARAAVLVALAEDGFRFVRKGAAFEPRPAEAVARIELERERVRLHAEEREAVVRALGAVARGEPWVGSASATERRCLAALEAVAVDGRRAEEGARELAVEILDATGVEGDGPVDRAFFLLRRAGRFVGDDENLEIVRLGLRREFPEAVTSAAARAAARGPHPVSREDLTDLEAVTVDGPATREIDDALTVARRAGGGFDVGVHIADPSSFIEPGDAVDAEALARGTAYYFPEARIPMIPAAISERAASLVAGEARPSLSFFAEIAPEGEVVSYRIARSTIRSHARLDYAQADAAIALGEGPHAPLLRVLVEATGALEARRLAAGAVLALTPDIEAQVSGDGRVRLERIDPDSPSRRMVSEAMVLAGALAARYCLENGVPALYRRQSAPQRLPPGPRPWEIRDAVAARAALRSLRRAEVGVQPGAHFALGLPAYTQATSPLRRYQDLVVHRQILAALEGRAAPHDGEALQRIAATTERAEADARASERACERYWRLRYLEQTRAEIVDAVVVEARPATVLLLDTRLEETVPWLTGAEPGEQIEMRVERVNPRADLLVLRPV